MFFNSSGLDVGLFPKLYFAGFLKNVLCKKHVHQTTKKLE